MSRYHLLTLLTLIAVVFSNCSDPEEEYRPLIPTVEGVPAGGVSEVSIEKVSGDTIELSMNLFAVDHFGKFIEGLAPKNFSVETSSFSPIEFQVLEVTETVDNYVGPFSAALLFDQSGSINSTDPQNDRITAGVSFSSLVNTDERAMIAAFSSGGNYPSPFGTLVDFTNDQSLLQASIESLAGRAGGGTPLYQAIYNLIPIVANEPTNMNQAIIAFTDGEDTDGGVTISEVVDKACMEGISIFTVGLGEGVEQSELSEIAFRTGGSVMLAEDALQLISIYSSLGELLRGEGRFYNVRFRAISNSPLQVGNIVNGEVILNLTDTYSLQFPFSQPLTIENAGDLDQRVPSCSCIWDEEEENPITIWQEKATTLSREILPEPNPEIENLRITCMYADLYHQNPDQFKWAGLAAIVSGIIGEKAYDENLLNQLGGDPFGMRTSIIQGNLAVFNDLAWMHLAYLDGGIDELGKLFCYASVNEPESFTLEVYRAWLKIDSRQPENVYAGNLDILKHEQLNILQDIIYSPYPILWGVLEELGEVVSPVPGHNEDFPGSDIENFDQRWNWLESSIMPKWREYEGNSSNAFDLREEHRSYCSNCCD